METVEELFAQKEIVDKITFKLMSGLAYPEFGEGGVPLPVAAKALGKDQTWVKAGIICGWLPIGYATKKGKLVTSLDQIKPNEKASYYISPKKLWEESGFIWKGEKVHENPK